MSPDTPEQFRIRQAKRERLLDEGVEPYPVAVPVTHTLKQIRETYPDLPTDAATADFVGVAGRVVFARNSGKLCFATLQEGDGTQLQVMISLARVGQDALDRWKSDVDLGDIVFVHGEVISSRRGELSVLADSWQMAAKALRPLPVAHKEMSEESRVRQRYVDLIMRAESRVVARQRVAVVRALRNALHRRDFLEVETPMLQTLAGGAAARPFVTHSNALASDLYLRIAPELFLKRCVVGGFDRVFELSRVFRNEGADSTHSPEFSMLETYQAYGTYDDSAEMIREVIQEVADEVFGTRLLTLADGTRYDIDGEWASVEMYPSLSEALGELITPDTSVAASSRHRRSPRHRDPQRSPLRARQACRRIVGTFRWKAPECSDIRARFSGGNHAADASAPQHPRGDGEVGSVCPRIRVGHGLFGIDRSSYPARAVRSPGPSRRRG